MVVPDRLIPGLGQSLPAMYLQSLVLSLVAFDLWPRVWQRMAGEPIRETGGYL